MKAICLLLPFISHYRYKVLPLGSFLIKQALLFSITANTVMIHSSKSSSVKIMLFVFKCKPLPLSLYHESQLKIQIYLFIVNLRVCKPWDAFLAAGELLPLEETQTRRHQVWIWPCVQTPVTCRERGLDITI